jgi:hypothetical protein
VALNLPGYEVSHCAEDAIDGVLRLSVIPKEIVDLCPDCGCPCNTWHQKRWLENILDFPLGGTPRSPIVAEGTWATHRLVERAAELVRRSDVLNAAGFFGIPEKTLERWYYDYVERQKADVETIAQPIRSLGIDELSLKKSTANSSR